MSFSSQVKAELCRSSLSRRCCAQAETYGVLLYCNQFTPRQVRIVTEAAEFAQRLPALFQKAFRLAFDRMPEEGAGKRTFQITAPDKLCALFSAFGQNPAESLAHHINFAVLEEEHCRTALDAAQEQIEAIYTLEQRGMLAELPDKLKEAVDLRMAHPEMTLSQLCTLCDPPVSKSALNHRLRKLLGLAKR